MKTLTTITISLLLLVIAAATPAATEPASVLLQEGLYAEEIKGDLDAAIKIYQKVLAEAENLEHTAARATYQLGMCYLKKGDKEKAAEYFDEVVNYYPEQTTVVKKAQAQLDKMGISKVKQGSIFEILGPVVCSYIGSKYGEVCAEAGAKKLYSNSHIYVVDSDFVLRGGGMGYVYNWTGQPITEHHRLTGTSYPNQKLYSMYGDEMDVKIVPDENRNNFYNVYWNPEKPLQPGEFFNYGWALDGTKQLSPTGAGGKYSLTMQNNFGQYAYETFFLAVPQGTVLSGQSEEYTGKGTANNWDIYWWKKVVQQDENHVEQVMLKKAEIRYTFGPVTEKIINDDGVGEDFMFDLDTGKSFSASDAKKWAETSGIGQEKSLEDFIMKSGVDLFGETSKKSLMGINMIAMPTHNERWDISPEDVIEQISMGKAGSPIPLSADGELPKTFVFKTGQGGMGILQITEMQAGKAPRHFKIRYKMLQRATIDLRQDKMAAENLTSQGWKLWGQRKLTEAEGKFKEAIAKDPKSEGAYQGLGWAQLNQGKKLNAKDSFEKCIKLNSKNSAALNGLGWIAYGQGNKDEAISWWEKAIEAQPDATASLNGLAQVYMERKEYDKAIKYYEMWLKAEPNNKQAKEGLEKAKTSNKN